MDLLKIAEDIRNIISEKQKELNLSFIEEDHLYHMNGRNDYPSVSKIIKRYYKEFPSEEIAHKKAKGDEKKAIAFLKQWSDAADYAANLGSRVHYFLEKKLIDSYGSYKEVREPIFECDMSQKIVSERMIQSGVQYLNLMKERGAVLLDTEMILGDPELGYVGQPDKVWLIPNKDKSDYGIIITDWKTNKDKSFEVNDFTEKMFEPFENYNSTAMGHYYIQLPLYARLLLKMLSQSKYGTIKVYGCIICHLKKDGGFVEYRVPKEVIDIVFDLKIS
jgi:hypothetical protein